MVRGREEGEGYVVRVCVVIEQRGRQIDKANKERRMNISAELVIKLICMIEDASRCQQ